MDDGPDDVARAEKEFLNAASNPSYWRFMMWSGYALLLFGLLAMGAGMLSLLREGRSSAWGELVWLAFPGLLMVLWARFVRGASAYLRRNSGPENRKQGSSPVGEPAATGPLP